MSTNVVAAPALSDVQGGQMINSSSSSSANDNMLVVNDDYFTLSTRSPSSSRSTSSVSPNHVEWRKSPQPHLDASTVVVRRRDRSTSVDDTGPIRATACFDFNATNHDEVSFQRGSKVVVVNNQPRNEEKYVIVDIDGKRGLAPREFLRPIGRLPPFIKEKEISPIGQYLGEGTYSKVSVALFKKKKYAIKAFRNTDAQDMAKHEAECINAMDHKNIIKVFAICLDPALIVLEYCEGGQLVNLIKHHNFNPPLRIIMKYAMQVADALCHMHNRVVPMCHHDIKPSNILIKEIPCTCFSTQHQDSPLCSTCGKQRLSRLTLKITDFGLAKLSDSHAITKDVSGSAPYISPEIFKGESTYKADVWSFGVVIWEMLTKRTPYQEYYDKGYNPLHIMLNISRDNIHLEIPRECPRDLQNVMKQCWTFDVDQRPSMNTIREMLRNFEPDDPEYIVINDREEVKQKLAELLMPKGDIKMGQVRAPMRHKISKNEIGLPSGFRHLVNVTNENECFAIHDSEHQKREPMQPAVKSPSDLQRRKAIRRQDHHAPVYSRPAITNLGNVTVEDRPAIISPPPGVSKTTTFSAIDDSVSPEPVVEVADDYVENTHKASTSNGSLKDSSSRSPSISSQSKFYISIVDGGSTVVSDKQSSGGHHHKKSGGIISNIKQLMAKPEPSRVTYNPKTLKYYNASQLVSSSGGDIGDFDLNILSLSTHHKTVTLANVGIRPNYVKYHDQTIKNRRRRTNPVRHQSTVESVTSLETPTTPGRITASSRSGSASPSTYSLNAAVIVPSSKAARSRAGSMGDVYLALSSSNNSPGTSQVDNNTGLPTSVAPVISHAKSKSSETSQTVDAVFQRVGKLNIVANPSYFRNRSHDALEKPELSTSAPEDDANHYLTLGSGTAPALVKRKHPGRFSTDSALSSGDPPPLPPRSLTEARTSTFNLDTPVEKPADRISPSSLGRSSMMSSVSTLDIHVLSPGHQQPTSAIFTQNGGSSPNSNSSSANDMPTTRAPILRPDSLPIPHHHHRHHNSQGTIPRESRYLYIAGQQHNNNASASATTTTSNGHTNTVTVTDDVSHRIPHIPKYVHSRNV